MASSDEDDASSLTEYENRYEELPPLEVNDMLSNIISTKQIVLMLDTHHDISMHERTLKR